MSGPTQTAEWGGANQWRARPAVSRLIRALIFVVPITVSFGLSWWASKTYPPERLEMNTIVWWIMIALLAIIVMSLTDRVARRFLPLAALLKLSLVFPDEAPSRFKRALRHGTTNQLSKQMKDHKEHGRFTDETTYGDYLLGLTTALADHDRLTRGHSERVRAYTDMIAEEMGLPEADRTKLHWAALLHDVGKLEVPGEILNKQGRPDEEEWAVLQGHPEAAMSYLEPLKPWLGEWLHAADEHHLRWDGNGYPKKIGGLQISLAGRIVAVADAYDVMTSARSYKMAMSAEDARTELAQCAGTQFDPAVTRAFLNIGLGRLRLATGPLSWLGHTFGLETVSLGGAAAPVASAATTAVQTVVGLATIASVAAATNEEPPEPPPAAVAFADDSPAAIAEFTIEGTPLLPVTVPPEPAPPADLPPETTTTTTTTTIPSTAALLTSDVTQSTSTTTAPTTTTTAAPTTTTAAAPTTTTTTSTTVAPVITTTTTAAPTTTTTAAPTTTTTTTAAPTTTTTTTAAPTTTTTTTTTTTIPVNLGPTISGPASTHVYASHSTDIAFTSSDPEGDDLQFSAVGLPTGITIDPDTGNLSGFVPVADAAVPGSPVTHDVTITVDDGNGNTADHDVTLDAVMFPSSPLHGRLILTEILFEGTQLTPLDEFVELGLRTNEVLDLTGITVTDVNPLFGDATDDSTFAYTLADGSLDGSLDERAVVWIDRITRLVADVPGAEYEGESNSFGFGTPRLKRAGDEIFVFDADGLLIDYVAWGDDGAGSELGEAPTADVDVWNDTFQADFSNIGVNSGQSISLTAQSNAAMSTSACWEPTGSGDAAANGCVGAATSIDTDGWGSRKTNVSSPEY